MKTTLERPKRIDDAYRQIPALSFVTGFERVNARLLKLRMHQALQQFRAERTRFRSQNDPAVTFAEIIYLRCEIPLHNRGSLTSNWLAHAFPSHISKLEVL